MITTTNLVLLTIFSASFIGPIYLDWRMRKKDNEE